MTQESQLAVQSVRKLANCMIVVGPDQQVGVFMPISQEAVWQMPITSEVPRHFDKHDLNPTIPPTKTMAGQPRQLKPPMISATTGGGRPVRRREEDRADHRAQALEPACCREHPTQHPKISLKMWACEWDRFRWKLALKSDWRTYIELWDHGDGYCDVWRKWKPVHGRSVKDVPIRECPIAECFDKITAWAVEGPNNWRKVDAPITHEMRARIIARRAAIQALRRARKSKLR